MAFKVFEKSSAPLAKVPTVTIQKRGLISLNRSAHALIGSADAVEFLFDADRQVVGLRPVPEESPNAYPVRAQTSKNSSGPLLIAGTAFTKYHQIDTTEARRWVPTVEDGILCIDLNAESQRVVSNRERARLASEEH